MYQMYVKYLLRIPLWLRRIPHLARKHPRGHYQQSAHPRIQGNGQLYSRTQG